MIRSSGHTGSPVRRSLEAEVRSCVGAVAARVVDAGASVVEEHAHDWPVLSLYVLGDYRKSFDGGELRIRSPSVVLHGAGAFHANQTAEVGLEQLDIQFDPAWLGLTPAEAGAGRVRCWLGGSVALDARRLVSRWRDPAASEAALARATAEFLRSAFHAREPARPSWLEDVLNRLEDDFTIPTPELARRAGVHPAWLTQIYRSSTGEGLREAQQRRRVEQATALLRGTELGAAEIAVASGFCDQSHMIRCFKSVLGRTPTQVRSESSRMSPAA